MGLTESPDRADVVERSHVGIVVSVGTTQVEAKAGSSRVESRQIVYIQNTSKLYSVFWGPSGVTTTGSARGIELAAGQFVSLPFGDVAIFLISAQAGGVDVVVGEVG
jgi:hypothetical protein